MSKQSIKKSTEPFGPEEEEPYLLNKNVNYSLYLTPKTDRIFEFKSKRLEFRRRPQNKNC